MRVKIVKCSEVIYWYFQCIGLTFEVEEISNTDYVVLGSPHQHQILKEDCEIVRGKLK